MKSVFVYIIALIFIVFGLYESVKLGSKKEESVLITPSATIKPSNEPLVGGDKDEHGCIPSAGYSWCTPKNKCLRVWEEKCYSSVEEEIRYILAEKYSRSVDEVKVTISKQNDLYAGGSVLFGKGGPGEGGMFLARKNGNIWEVVFDGNGNVDCNKMRQDFGFPDEILTPNFCE